MSKDDSNEKLLFGRPFWYAFIFAFTLSLIATASFAAGSRFMPLKQGDLQMQKNHHFISLRSAGTQGKSLAIAHASKRSFSLRDYKPRILRPANRLPFAKKIISSQATEQEKVSIEQKHDRGENTLNHIWPVDPSVKQYISSPFGYRADPFTGEKAFHSGIDIAAARGTKVLATAEGVVAGVGKHGRLGKYVRIDHNEEEYTLYGHLSKINVTAGEEISAGDVIGEIGSTGRSTGPHLDYSLRKNGKPVNPKNYLIAPPTQQTASLEKSVRK